jgi:hypothetical protein
MRVRKMPGGPVEAVEVEVDKKVFLATNKGSVEETSKRLQEALDQNDPHNPLNWGNANKAKESPLDPEFQRIVSTVFIDSPMKVYKRLERGLYIGERRGHPDTVKKALDLAERNARLAHKLWMTATVEEVRWKHDNAIVWATIRQEATRELQRQKDQGSRNKTITDADVDSMCSLLHHDEYRAQEISRARVKAMVRSLEDLTEKWNSRCRSLQAMIGKLR